MTLNLMVIDACMFSESYCTDFFEVQTVIKCFGGAFSLSGAAISRNNSVL